MYEGFRCFGVEKPPNLGDVLISSSIIIIIAVGMFVTCISMFMFCNITFFSTCIMYALHQHPNHSSMQDVCLNVLMTFLSQGSCN